MSLRMSIAVLVAIGLGIFVFAGCDGISGGYKQVSVAQAKAMLQTDSKIRLVDVRTDYEYRAGHIDGATLLPLPQVEKAAKRQFSSSDEILVYCQSGERSAEAAKILSQQGFTNVYNMVGGTDEWRAKGYPLVK